MDCRCHYRVFGTCRSRRRGRSPARGDDHVHGVWPRGDADRFPGTRAARTCTAAFGPTCPAACWFREPGERTRSRTGTCHRKVHTTVSR